MSGREQFEAWAASPLVPGPSVCVGELVALADGGRTPMVFDPTRPDIPALAARTVVDLHAPHVGQQVLLVFESGEGARPIVIGVLRNEMTSRLHDSSGQVQVDVDGERLVVEAKQQLVLRCGKASITLRRAKCSSRERTCSAARPASIA